MLTPGILMPVLALIGLYLVLRKKLADRPWVLRLLAWSIPLPYLANSAGWIMAEVGRQPWIVYDLMLTRDAVSPGVASGLVLFSLLAFTLIYGVLMAVDVYLLAKYARQGTTVEPETPAEEQSSALAAAH
jgi:cytochrome d ubiquinol oxidase subunit I